MKLLIPVDFSPNSTKAFEFALGLFMGQKVTFRCVHVIEMVYDFASQTALEMDKLHQDARLHLETLQKTYSSPNVVIETELLEGTPSIQLANLARSEEIDLVVMGTLGKTGLTKLFAGSTALNMIKESPVPVLIVPEAAQLESIRTLGLALEFSNHEETVIEAAVTWANCWKMDLQIIHHSKGNPFFEKCTLLGLKHHLESKDLTVSSHLLVKESLQTELVSLLEQNENLLLGLCPSHKNAWNQLLGKGDTLDLAKRIHQPMLILI